MIRRLAQRARTRRGDDQGIAMIMVMASITVLALLVTAALGYALQQQPQARHDQDWNASLAAAQAGIDDYIARLNQNDSYWQTVDCTNPALKGPKAGTNTCGWTTSTAPGWQNLVLGHPGPRRVPLRRGRQRDLQPGRRPGHLHRQGATASRAACRSWWRAAGRPTSSTTPTSRTRTRRTRAPTRPARPRSAAARGPTNANYWFEGRSGCTEITFVSGDQLDGQVHFNDTPLISGSPTFLQGLRDVRPRLQDGHRTDLLGVLPRLGDAELQRVQAGVRRPAGPAGQHQPVRDVPGLPVHRRHPDQVQRRRHHDRLEQEERRHGHRHELRRPDHPGHRRVGDGPGPHRPGHLRQERQHAGQVHRRPDRRRPAGRQRRQPERVHVLLRQRQRLGRGHAQGPGHAGRRRTTSSSPATSCW